MNILVIGSGGREHALVWKIKQSPKVRELYCAPGNGGIEDIAQCVDIKADDVAGLLKFAQDKKIDLTVVGPEIPLVAGIVDEFEKNGLKIFGPSRLAARLEGSKIFSKEFMRRQHIPTANFQVFDNLKKAMHLLKALRPSDYPIVIKADGLAAGKGVVICHSSDEARETLAQMLEQKVFKEAGTRVLIEEFLTGPEVSILAICDGDDFVMLESAQDHKRIFDDDCGPNTGGMGAYSPAPVISSKMIQAIADRVMYPALRGMRDDGTPFKGVLYAGLMLAETGPHVLEFNVRFGDPEAQALIPRLKNDLVDVMLAGCEGRLKEITLNWDTRSCVCVVMSSGGYPGEYETGKEITGLEAVRDPQAIVFHAGTRKVNEKILTAGGRVLGVTGLGNTTEAAIKTAYEAVDKIKFDRCFFRRDIGQKALKVAGSK